MPGLHQRANRARSAIRSAVRHVFAEQKECMALSVRTIGLGHATVKSRSQPRPRVPKPPIPPNLTAKNRDFALKAMTVFRRNGRLASLTPRLQPVYRGVLSTAQHRF